VHLFADSAPFYDLLKHKEHNDTPFAVIPFTLGIRFAQFSSNPA
jgi:hypothetical protein